MFKNQLLDKLQQPNLSQELNCIVWTCSAIACSHTWWCYFRSNHLNSNIILVINPHEFINILLIQAKRKVKLLLTCAQLSKVSEVTKKCPNWPTYNISVMTRGPNVQNDQNFQKWPKGTKMSDMFKNDQSVHSDSSIIFLTLGPNLTFTPNVSKSVPNSKETKVSDMLKVTQVSTVNHL